jgi:hypothetical protein
VQTTGPGCRSYPRRRSCGSTPKAFNLAFPLAATDSDSTEGSKQIFEGLATVGMIQDIPLRHMMTEIRDFQDGQDSSILTAAAAVDLISQPLTHSVTACLARGDPTACGGKGVYGLRS